MALQSLYYKFKIQQELFQKHIFFNLADMWHSFLV